MSERIAVFWFRRDLRLEDNVGFHRALRSGHRVLPLFVFDKEILDPLPKDDARLHFIHGCLSAMQRELLERNGCRMAFHHGTALEAFRTLTERYDIAEVHTNDDYEPYARQRDGDVTSWLKDRGIPFRAHKDQVIFEKGEITKDDGSPYVVYTPYRRKWMTKFQETVHLIDFEIGPYRDALFQGHLEPMPSVADLGFTEARVSVPDYDLSIDLIRSYKAKRNFPGLSDGTSRVGIYLRFGALSVRQVVRKALQAEDHTFLGELIWREFFMQILWHFPHTVDRAFKPAYDRIAWRNQVTEFERWKDGQTGFPLVDAGMRELNLTGHMHNRVRMLVSSFLCKHLLIDWRWGEAYFAEKLLDYEQASNVGNWQWAAGSGVDAAPYFRIFNPSLQVNKFDKDGAYVRRWVEEFEGFGYPAPMVEHKMARDRCLKVYKEALGG